MGGSFLLPFIAYQLERFWQGLYELIVHSYIELEQVGLPCAIWIDAACPPYLDIIGVQPLLVIHKVIRFSGRIGYHVGLTEHQEPGTGDAAFTCRHVARLRPIHLLGPRYIILF